MTTPRDTLADLIEAAGTPEAAADAVLANVPGLVWSQIDEQTAWSRRRYVSDRYIIEYRLHGEHFDLWMGHNATKALRFDALEAAQAAAETDHRARLAQAMGWA